MTKTDPQKASSSWVWTLFIISAFVFVSTVFISGWTSTGPTFFPTYEVNPTITRLLPTVLQVPSIDWELSFPIVAVLLICVCLRFIRSTNSSRFVMKLILLFLATRYFTWRTVVTLNFSHPASIVFFFNNLHFRGNFLFFLLLIYTANYLVNLKITKCRGESIFSSCSFHPISSLG